MMMQTIREKDADTLQYLTNVECSETQEPITVTVKLTYRDNEYFTNKTLELMVRFKDDQQDEVVETQGTLIDWKDGKDLSKKKIKKKQKNKKTGETRTIVKTVPADSFFNVFESKKAPEGAADQDEDDEDEETAKLLDGLDEAMQVALDFQDLYNWEALEYYLNFGQSLGDFAGMHDDCDSHGDGEDDGSDEEKEKPKKKAVKGPESSAAQAGAGGAADGKQQECKQQ